MKKCISQCNLATTVSLLLLAVDYSVVCQVLFEGDGESSHCQNPLPYTTAKYIVRLPPLGRQVV